MSANCNYSKKFLPLVRMEWVKSEMNPTQFKQRLSELFLDDPEILYTKLESALTQQERTTSVGSKKLEGPMIQGRMTLDETPKSYKDLYVGRSDLLMSLEQKFRTGIVTRSVFDIPTSTFIDSNEIDKKSGLTTLNKNIVDYKQSLLNTLSRLIGSNGYTLDYSMDANEYSNVIQTALNDYMQWKADNPENTSGLNEFSILAKFDELLANLTKFIAPKNVNLKDSPNRYEYKGPNVNHYTTFGEQNASVESQVSDLADVLLTVLPEVGIDEHGNEYNIEGSFIGLSGFNSAMMSLKQDLLFGDSNFVDEYYKGVNINLGEIIEDYLGRTTKVENQVDALFDLRQTFLTSKLRGLNKFIFNNSELTKTEKGKELINDMKSMFFKTEAVSYRGYEFNDERGKLIGRNLRSGFISNQKFQLQDSLRGGINLLRTDSAERERIKNDFGINLTSNKITFRNGSEQFMITYSGDLKKGFNFKLFGNPSKQFIEGLVSDLMAYIIPDTYSEVGLQVDGKAFNFANDWAPLIGLSVLGGYGDNQLSFNRGVVDLSQYSMPLLKVAKKMSVIYGSETKNVIRNPNGDKIPLYQLTNLTYNTKSILHDLKVNGGANADNIFSLYKGLLAAPQVRSQIKIGNSVKEPSSLTQKELIQLSAIEDFYVPLTEEKNPVIYLQNATFADKSTHYLQGYNVSTEVTLPTGEKVKLQKLIEDALAGDSSTLHAFTRVVKQLRINNVADAIVSKYNTAFDKNFNTLEEVDKWLIDNPISVNAIQKAFNDKEIQFDLEVDAYERGKTARINETLLNYWKTYNSPELFRERMRNARRSFIQGLQENQVSWNRYDSPTFEQIAQKYENWVDPVSGELLLYNGQALHPVLEAYFATDMLLSNEFNALTIGEVWAHPNKNKNETNSDPNNGEVGTYEEFSEASRLIAQIKRSVAFGATYHPYTQGLNNGVAENIDIAVMSDMSGFVFSPNGASDEVDSMDGSGLAHPLEARFENNSLLSARVGDNKKSIMMGMDYKTNKPILLKWAVYSLTNQVRRDSTGSYVSGENLYQRMSSRPLEKTLDLKLYFDKYSKDLTFYDRNQRKYFRILDVSNYNTNSSNWADRQLIEVDPTTNENVGESFWESELNDDAVKELKTLYDLDQFFGGAWTVEWNNETKSFDWNEGNLDILELILSDENNQSLKSKFIAYTVNKSAIKVGAGNINSEETWRSGELLTIPMSTKYGGIQMDADHELDEADVTEMTQMLSALIENGHYPELVKQIYSEIGQTVDKHMSRLTGYVDAINNGDTEAREKLYQILANALFKSFRTNNRDTIGLAQSFVELAQKAIAENNLNYKIPFSAATINGIFISDIISDINRGGIRHKYDGFAGVLNPSYNMIQFYKVQNPRTGEWEFRMYKELCDFAWDLGVKDTALLKETFINGQLNPLCKPISANQIEFEDTIVISNGQQYTAPIYINTFKQYDDIKARLRKNPSLQVFLHTGYGRNLRGADTRFTVNGREYSIYDLDSVRVAHYLTYDTLTPEQQALIDKLGVSTVEQANNITQNTLKLIEQNLLIPVNEAFELDGIEAVLPTNVYTRPPEIITGRYQGEKFGLTENDHIFQIKDANFFRNKLTGIYEAPENVPTNLYDVVLFEGKKKWLVKIGDEKTISNTFTSTANISDNPEISYNGDDVVYNNEILLNKTGFQFKQYVDNGDVYGLIAVDSVDRYRQLLKTGLFNRRIQLLNITAENVNTLKDLQYKDTAVIYTSPTETIAVPKDLLSIDAFRDSEIYRIGQMLTEQAGDMYESFQKQLYYVGARIPTQAMQSFMPMRVVGWINTKTNIVYVPAAQTWLQGSDYRLI